MTWHREEQIAWRRIMVLQYLSLGLSQNETASKLKVDKSTVSEDVRYLTQVARNNVKEYLEERLSLEFEKTVKSLESIESKPSK